MIPLSLTITNFRSFGTKPQRFVFPTAPGLYFMSGENRLEPKLGANGAGKSTIWAALCWVLYGKTAQGLKSGDVANWEVAKGVRVDFEFADADGVVHTLCRTWGPITLTLDGADLGKEYDAPIDYTPFLHCVLMAQGQPMFLDLKSDPQAALFTEVLKLDDWLERSKRASTAASAADLRVRQAEQRVAALYGRLQALQSTSTQADYDDWEAQRNKRLSEIDADVLKWEQQERRLEKELESLERAARVAAKAAHDALTAMDVAQRAADEIKERERTEAAQLDAYEEALRKLRARPKLKIGEGCSHCGQVLSIAAAREHRQALEAEEADLLATISNYDDVLKSRRGKLTKAQANAAGLQAVYTEALMASERASLLYEQCRRALADATRNADGFEDEGRRALEEENPHGQALKRAASDRRAAQTEHDEASTELDALRERYALCALWVKGFKEVRLRAITEALVELELEANSALVQLGLMDWALMFSVERETKGGTMSRGFDVRVSAPDQKRPMPWAAWSGGEAQRLRVGATMGLSDLIRARCGLDFPLEVWDEPTAGLSAGGVDDLMESLHQRAITEQRQIWVVDHRSLSYGGFAGTVLVVKDESGSHIEVLE